MPENLAITITGSLLQEWMEVFGTDTVPIDPPIPVAIEHTDGSRSGAFVVAFEKLAQEQQQRVVKHLADKHGLAISEVKEVLGRDGLAVPAEHCVMQRVTKSQIDMIRHGFRENFMPRHPEADEIVEAFTIAREIICFRLGHEWWTRNVFDELGSNAERMRYLRPSLGGEKERLESQDRVIDLADSLFLLQDCEGFDLKIRDLRKVSPTRPHVALEDAAIELQVAKTLVKSGHDVRFVAPSRTKSQDYDLQVNFKERISLNTEIKCRREDTAANVSSLRRIMNRAARKQLPADNPSILFVRLPPDRAKDIEFVSQMGKFICSFFDRFPHVNATVITWEEWVVFPRNLRARLLKYQLELNSSPRYPVNDLDELLLRIESLPKIGGTFLSLSFGEFGY